MKHRQFTPEKIIGLLRQAEIEVALGKRLGGELLSPERRRQCVAHLSSGWVSRNGAPAKPLASPAQPSANRTRYAMTASIINTSGFRF
jgi:hypothetical protein